MTRLDPVGHEWSRGPTPRRRSSTRRPSRLWPSRSDGGDLRRGRCYSTAIPSAWPEAAGEPEPGTAPQESHSDCMAGPPTDNAGWSHDHHDHLPVHQSRAAGPPRPRPRPRVRRPHARRASLGARVPLRRRPPCPRRVLGRHLRRHVGIRPPRLHAAARRPVRRHPEPLVQQSTPSSPTRLPVPTRATAATASTSSTTPASSAGTSARRSGRRRPPPPECRSPSTSRSSTPPPGMPRCEGVAVYAWHADAQGRYSMYSQGVENENYLRGVQPTDAAGTATFRRSSPGATTGAGRTSTSRSTAAPPRRRVTARSCGRARSPCRRRPARRPTPTPRRTRRARANLSRTSLTRDMVFGDDGGIHQLATVSGDADQRLRRQPHHRGLTQEADRGRPPVRLD